MSKQKKEKPSDYSRIVHKILVRTVLSALFSVSILWVLYVFFLRGRIANLMVYFMQTALSMDYYEALSVFHNVFRQNSFIIMGLAFAVLYLLIFRVSLRPVTGYFTEISQGVDSLLDEDAEEVRLSADLSSLEKNLNEVKRSLASRKLALQTEEKRKNDLVVYLAHDLKTPLTSVIGYLTLLHDEPQISPQLQERYLGIALDKSQRLEDLINEFFDITRFSLTHLTLETSRINLTRMVEQIAYEFAPVMQEKNLSWDLQLEPNIEMVCDVDKLQRVFDNLIRNALYYSDAGSAVSIQMHKEGEHVRIEVENTGKTIAPEKLNHIFEQFYRLDSSRASNTGGVGLGLAITKEIVELHGGTISAQSQNERICFSLELPLESHKNVRIS